MIDLILLLVLITDVADDLQTRHALDCCEQVRNFPNQLTHDVISSMNSEKICSMNFYITYNYVLIEYTIEE